MLAQGFGDGAGQDEDEVHHFLDKDQGKGQVDGVEVGGRRDVGQRGGEESQGIEFDADDAQEEGRDLGYGDDPPGFLVFPEGEDGIEDVGGQFVECHHKGFFIRGLP